MPAVAAAAPAITAASAAASAGATVYAASKSGKGGGGVVGVDPYAGLTPAQKDAKIAAESRFADLQVGLQNKQLDIAASQAEADNANVRAGGWLKIAGAVALGVIVFLILRKKKVIEI